MIAPCRKAAGPRERWLKPVVYLAALLISAPAAADRYEATFTVRPVGGIGQFTENVAADGKGTAASTYGAGAEVGFAYGLRNWLDVNVEAVGAAFTQASYESAMVMVNGITTLGHLTRTTRLAQLRAGATLRLGVAWVPFVHLGLGLSARMPTAGVLRDDNQGGIVEVTPDGMGQGVSLDLSVLARIGLEHRLDRRWSIGLTGEIVRLLGLGGPPANVVSAGVSLSYTWYPGWW